MRVLFTLIFLLSITTAVFAQDETWTPGEDGVEFNCAAVAQVQNLLGDADADLFEVEEVPFARANNQVMTIERYVSRMVVLSLQRNPETSLDANTIFGAAITVCGDDADTEASTETSSASGDTFNVTVTGNANMRSCAGTNCDVVAQAAAGQTLKVVGVEADWYEVELEDGTAFIASFLVTRAPDNIIPTDEPYVDARTGCIIAFDIKRGDADMTLILAGDSRSDVVVDLFRPNESVALRVEGQLDKTFIDTGEPYIHQYYRFNIGWPVGIYGIEITLNGETSKIAYEVEERADYNVFVMCD